MRTWTLSAVTALLMITAACGEDDASNGDNPGTNGSAGNGSSGNGSAGNGSGGNGSGGNDVVDPQYSIFYTNQTMEGITSLVATVSSLDASTTIVPEEAVPINGFIGLLQPPALDGSYFIAEANSSIIQRYDVDADGIATPGERLNYNAPAGNFMLRPNHYLSPDRAYFVAPSLQEVIVWNPQTVRIIERIDISGLAPDEETQNLIISDSFIEGGRLIIPAGYADNQTFEFEDELRAAFVDLATGEVTYDADTGRCGRPTLSLRDQAGAVYMASHPGQGANFAAGTQSFAPCMLRILPGASEIDPNYYLNMNDVTGGRPSASILQGQNGQAYTTVHPEMNDFFTPENQNTIRFSAEWSVNSFELGNEVGTLTPVPNLPIVPDQMFGQPVNILQPSGEDVDTPFVFLSNDQFDPTTVWDATDPNAWTAGVVVPGYIYRIIRIR
ncbi:MAG: hypothetical protein AAGD10_19330 [Myxococcota bacterium]